MASEMKEAVDSQRKPATTRSDQDIEAAAGSTSPDAQPQQQLSAFKGLGILDRFLALWIFLAMAIGIILGNFVPETGPALQKGKFVGVSVPIGMFSLMGPNFWHLKLTHA
jgi:ACR3 family arsenite transporter